MSKIKQPVPAKLDSDGQLLCPRCDFTGLHQSDVEIFNREEDSEHGLHVGVYKNSMFTDVLMIDNPSPRRQGMFIKFWCESCGYDQYNKKVVDNKLAIYQHKGTTYMEWL
jgi:predicted nucleic-acid-binding Zn-ribbon protein